MRVSPLDVVEVVDVVADRTHRRFASRVAHVVDELGTEGGEKTLGDRIVPAIALAAHALQGSAGSQRRTVFVARAGASAVGVMHVDFRTKTALRKHIAAFLERWNQNPTPFIWTKKPHRLIRDHRRMFARISHAAR
jgi:hypothetical protein